MGRSLKILTILALSTLALGACGKRGLLESPVAAEDGAPKKSASELKREAKAAELKRKGGTLDPSEKAHPKVTEAEHRPFVLDGLLR
jgi:predicted small lipoprotein YifL